MRISEISHVYSSGDPTTSEEILELITVISLAAVALI